MLAEVLCRLAPRTMRRRAHRLAAQPPTGRGADRAGRRGFTSTHLAIIASTGAGKSYLAGVILEELMRPHNRAAVLVIDPHAEYDTLVEMQGHPAFAGRRLSPPRVRIMRPTDIKVRVSSLDLGDLRYLLPNLSERMHYLLGPRLWAGEAPVRRHAGRAAICWWRSAGPAITSQPVTDPDER